MINEIFERRSVRLFQRNNGIKKTDLMNILEAARYAPSAKNLQPLEYIIVSNKKTKVKLAEYCQQPQPKICTCIVVIGNRKISRLLGEISSHSCTTSIKGETRFIYMESVVKKQSTQARWFILREKSFLEK